MRSVIGLLLLSVAVSANDAAKDGVKDDSLTRMVRAFHELNYDMSFIYQRDGLSEPMRLVHALEDGRERERLVHLNGQPREIVRENDSVVAYFPNRAPVVLDKPPTPTHWTQALVENLRQKQRFYRLVDAGEDRVAGRLARQVDVQSLDQQRHSYRLWLDSETHLLLRSDLIDVRGQVLEQWQVVSLQILDKVPEQSLAVSFKSPAPHVGVQVLNSKTADGDSKHSPWQVAWLPDGFEFKQRQWQKNGTQTVEHLLFSDGLAAISVYIGNPLPQGVRFARQIRKGGVVIYEVANAEQHVTIVGDIPSETARKIAVSVQSVVQKSTSGEM